MSKFLYFILLTEFSNYKKKSLCVKSSLYQPILDERICSLKYEKYKAVKFCVPDNIKKLTNNFRKISLPTSCRTKF